MSKKITCRVIKSAPLAEGSAALLRLSRLPDENRGIFETALPDMLPAYPGSLPIYTGLTSTSQILGDIHFFDYCV